jgi:hypothetical protein
MSTLDQKYKLLTRKLGGTLSVDALIIFQDEVEFQTSDVKQEYWNCLADIGEALGDSVHFATIDRELANKEQL